MNQQQRRRAQRLRAKRDGDETRPPRPLTAREATWLTWYDDNVVPSPIGKKLLGGAEDASPETDDQLRDDPDPEPEPLIPHEVAPEPEQLAEVVIAPEPIRPRYVQDPPREVNSAPRVVSPDVVQKLFRDDCENESLRSAINVQIAAGQMLERATVLALDIAERSSRQLSDLSQQLVDALTGLADAQHARAAEYQAQAQAPAQAASATEGLDPIGKKIVDHMFPDHQNPAPATAPVPTDNVAT